MKELAEKRACVMPKRKILSLEIEQVGPYVYIDFFSIQMLHINRMYSLNVELVNKCFLSTFKEQLNILIISFNNSKQISCQSVLTINNILTDTIRDRLWQIGHTNIQEVSLKRGCTEISYCPGIKSLAP